MATGFSPSSGNSTGFSPTYSNTASQQPSGWPSSYYGGGSGGGSSGDDGPTDEQKEAAKNLEGIVGYNIDTIIGSGENTNWIYDVSDKQNQSLRELQTAQNKRNAGDDWYTQQQKLQSVTSQLMDAGGNAYNGSSLYDVWDLIARKDDMDDASVLGTMRENQNTIDNNYYEALFASINGRNEQAMKTESSLREIAADYAAQLNNIHPDLVLGADEAKGGDGDNKDLIDTDGRTLNVPDWMKTSWFEENRKDAVTPTEQGWYRPALEETVKGLNVPDQRYTGSASNQSYRSRLYNGYDRRTV